MIFHKYFVIFHPYFIIFEKYLRVYFFWQFQFSLFEDLLQSIGWCPQHYLQTYLTKFFRWKNWHIIILRKKEKNISEEEHDHWKHIDLFNFQGSSLIWLADISVALNFNNPSIQIFQLHKKYSFMVWQKYFITICIIISQPKPTIRGHRCW